jgi:hypothetical protein
VHLQDHDGDHDRDHPVAEGFEAAGGHFGMLHFENLPRRHGGAEKAIDD